MSSSCDDLAQQIATLNTLVGRLNNLSEAKIRQIVNEIVNPQITEVTIHLEAASTTAKNALNKTTSFEATLRQMEGAISSAARTAGTALSTANTANTKATNAEAFAGRQAQETNAAFAEARQARAIAEQADRGAKTAGNEAMEAKAAAGTSTKIANNAIDEAEQAARKAALMEKQANAAFAKLNRAEDIAVTALRESKLAKGIANVSLDKSALANFQSSTAISKAANAANEALEANNAVGGLKGIVEGLKGRVGALGEAITAFESRIGNALTSAAKAVGISEEALAATGRLAGKVAEIFNIIGTFAVLIEQLATLKVLGGRIDAVERGLEFLGNSVSGILGKLLGLQNRIARNEATIVDVKAIAVDARLIGEGAARIAGDAQIHADRRKLPQTMH
ncbi:hypothetical protein [Nostoc sp. 'Peltigera membranacea cyanobiont' 232]|uniref:hypothetical protein n=1 Tax=Nostoc sp. 'Peltigera membranacea cyanobiont' 232 TaxID=2014531 RepID=UPI000B9550A2|nr:hypothetical protein [Nostoc sp. 'Peltigera membranacea cyanobiont' 232]OYE06263.1 hypothetical protein CDG79_02765 [Nostoc sp. 'Peltigera membranacea cyanobiont' 232]